MRCRQRLPIAGVKNGGRRSKFAEPAGGGGMGALAIAAVLLAGFVFIGGAAAIYLSTPPSNATLPPISQNTPSPTLPPFVQPTASPSPTPPPSPTFLPLSPLPTSSAISSETPLPPTTDPGGPTDPPRTPRPTCNANGNPPGCRPVTTDPPNPTDPGPAAPVARFNCQQQDNSTEISCNSNNSSGNIQNYSWEFEGGGSSTEANPNHDFGSYGNKSVTLTVSGPGGNDSQTKNIQVNEAEPTDPEPTPCDPPVDPCPPSIALPSAAPINPVPLSGSTELIAYGMIAVSVLSMVGTGISRRRRR